jgi:hypothetical protein
MLHRVSTGPGGRVFPVCEPARARSRPGTRLALAHDVRLSQVDAQENRLSLGAPRLDCVAMQGK